MGLFGVLGIALAFEVALAIVASILPPLSGVDAVAIALSAVTIDVIWTRPSLCLTLLAVGAAISTTATPLTALARVIG